MEISHNLMWTLVAAFWATIYKVFPASFSLLPRLGERNIATLFRFLALVEPTIFSLRWHDVSFDFGIGRVTRPIELFHKGHSVYRCDYPYQRGDKEGAQAFLKLMTLAVVDQSGPLSSGIQFAGWPEGFSELVTRLTQIHHRGRKLNHKCGHPAFPLGSILGIEELLRVNLDGATCPAEVPLNFLALTPKLEGTEIESQINALRPDRVLLHGENFPLDWGSLDEPVLNVPYLDLKDEQIRNLRFRYFAGSEEAGIVISNPKTGGGHYLKVILRGTVLNRTTGKVVNFSANCEKEFSRLAHKHLVQELFDAVPRPERFPEPIHFGSVGNLGEQPPWPKGVVKLEIGQDPFSGNPLYGFGTFFADAPTQFRWQLFLTRTEAEEAELTAEDLYRLNRLHSLQPPENE